MLRKTKADNKLFQIKDIQELNAMCESALDTGPEKKIQFFL